MLISVSIIELSFPEDQMPFSLLLLCDELLEFFLDRLEVLALVGHLLHQQGWGVLDTDFSLFASLLTLVLLGLGLVEDSARLLGDSKLLASLRVIGRSHSHCLLNRIIVQSDIGDMHGRCFFESDFLILQRYD